MNCITMRPSTLYIGKQRKHNETKAFIRDVYYVWKNRNAKNVVTEENVRELFNELNLYTTRDQIHDMLQTAKLCALRCNKIDKNSKIWTGITFGEFCILAADIRKIRPALSNLNFDKSLSCPHFSTTNDNDISTNIFPTSDDNSAQEPSVPEVFLGGSCNPTTWRADVAIPALNKLGISFYNPQVSQWTPDLIELEHRAKEKARVLFFVIDSETRATAGAIEAAHIAGQNLKHLVLVLHPYKLEQKILNEHISLGEFIDLSRNQKLLQQLVTRKGLPVLNNIPSALQRIKCLLSGNEGNCGGPQPSNVASRLVSIQRSYDTVSGNSEYGITFVQCQQALQALGYPNNVITLDNINVMVDSVREIMYINGTRDKISEKKLINFDEYCVITSYISVYQQEINNNDCVSPIKGTNLQPPPIFLTNVPEWINNQQHFHEESFSKQLTKSHTIENCKSLSDDRTMMMHENNLNRDSGTSSPQPNVDTKNCVNGIGSASSKKKTKGALNLDSIENEDESDSNDSVFSTGSSDDSNISAEDSRGERIEIRDIYLGGSCMLRTRWRQNIAMPLLKSKEISFHLPTLHENYPKILTNNNLNENLSIINNTCDNKVQLNSNSNISHDNILNQDAQSSSCNSSSSNSNNSNSSITENKSLNIKTEIGRQNSNDMDTLMFNSAILESSRILLFVITNETRSLAPMTLAAHYIGLGYNVVLCVQMLPDFCVIGNEKLTTSAIKDYNRGRAYLIDLAKRQGIPCFNEIQPAINCAIKKLQTTKLRNSV